MDFSLNVTSEPSLAENFTCPEELRVAYPSVFGIDLAIPEWEAIATVLILSFIIIFTVTGNILVILSVFTYRPLKTVQNFFIVSLAVADIFVASLVLPLNVAYLVIGRWEFGIHVCKFWLTADVMCCTASILNLCVIALDRFWAISKPLDYKRTLELVLSMIVSVWVLSLLISSPPLLGWNDWPEVFTPETKCQLTSNQGYVIYSALGSFFIPLVIMTVVYVEIFIATRRRLRERAKAASKINQIRNNKTKDEETKNSPNLETLGDADSVSSEVNYNEANKAGDSVPICRKHHDKKSKTNGNDTEILQVVANEDESNTYNPENSSESTKPEQEQKMLHKVEPNHNNATPTKKNKRKSVKKSGGISQFIEERQKISLSKERRAARVLGIVMGVFIACWLPFFLVYVIVPFCATCCPSERFINFITWLGYMNSGLNPIIYTVFNMDFRKAFKKLLRLKTRK
ncbi:octopamine receptor [Culicoides brevitarsis]|uniref:octopamine receptor n=1 Tax=Culicoides brevitarsis TaxID=469753 RepID=UPI00307C6DC4